MKADFTAMRHFDKVTRSLSSENPGDYAILLMLPAWRKVLSAA